MIPRSMTPRAFLFAALAGCVLLMLYFEIQVMNLEEGKRRLEAKLAQLIPRNEEQRPFADARRAAIAPNLQRTVIIYNRIPKTASTSFVGVAYDLCKQNNFHVLHINITANMHVLSLPNQLRFVDNITHWDAMKPAFYHGHMAYVDFVRLGASRQPLYINLVRRPLDRLVSYYYFLRFGDDYRPYLVRRKHGDKMTFDECVKQNQADCNPDNMWLQIPFFCGHSADCWVPGNKWALAEAKRNLIHSYFLVGVTEELGDFVRVLEASLPSFFRGATAHYETSNKSHLRKTAQKVEPSDETVAQIQKSLVWRMENELYEFALQQFHYAKKRVLLGPSEKTQSFMYEKIRPKRCFKYCPKLTESNQNQNENKNKTKNENKNKNEIKNNIQTHPWPLLTLCIVTFLLSCLI